MVLFVLAAWPSFEKQTEAMKPYNINLQLAIVLLFLLLIGCSKERSEETETPDKPSYENELPPVTSSGANTIGFLLNNNVFTPKGTHNSRANFKARVNPETGSFRIEILRVEDNFLYEFRLVSDELRGVGEYPISKATYERIYFSKHTIQPDGSLQFNCLTQNFVSLLYDAKGTLKVTKYDTKNNVYSGTFEATFSNPDCKMGTQINITQGRFDVKSDI